MQIIKNINFCKIISTVGPASQSPKMLDKLVKAGTSVFRINFSHASEEQAFKIVKAIRSLEKKYSRPLAVLCDLQGPKFRIGKFKNKEAALKNGATFYLDNNPAPGDETRVRLPHMALLKSLKPGLDILVNDGLVRLRVESVNDTNIKTTVITGGVLSDKKGVNIPGIMLPVSSLTPKDKTDLKIAEKVGADFIGLSFLQSAKDIKVLRKLMKSDAGIIAKIEKPAAVEHLQEIIAAADAVMIARGDLGVELRPEQVPVVQKKIITACRAGGKPVIVATQMLESMTYNPTPTRAEASDVANAVYDGADAVMLSGETAGGKYPLEAVRTMHDIIENVVQDPLLKQRLEKETSETHNIADAITAAAKMTAAKIETANLIVNFTFTGLVTLNTAKHRPFFPILSLTPEVATARKMALTWGTIPMLVNDPENFEDLQREVRAAALRKKLAKKGDSVVVTARIPLGKQGDTNLLYVMTM